MKSSRHTAPHPTEEPDTQLHILQKSSDTQLHILQKSSDPQLHILQKRLRHTAPHPYRRAQTHKLYLRPMNTGGHQHNSPL
ncbi:hypothetical protein BgiBS90_004371 [Biomphalaria glabrata]|nr:hypothetical protein BgiBS90_004371 [Biomphalaria glabrata]